MFDRADRWLVRPSNQAARRYEHGPPPPSQRFANILCTLGQIAFYLYMPYWLKPRCRRSGPFTAHTWWRLTAQHLCHGIGRSVYRETREEGIGKEQGRCEERTGPRLEFVSGSGPSGIHKVLLRHTHARGGLITYQTCSVLLRYFGCSDLVLVALGRPRSYLIAHVRRVVSSLIHTRTSALH